MGPDYVLIADIDGTLFGDDAALERFALWYAGNRHRYRLAYATGRHRESLERLVADSALPVPDAAITAVGTEIHDGQWRRWPGWPERFAGFDAQAARLAVRAFRQLAPQPDDAQTSLKASYDARDLGPSDLAGIRRALVRAGQDARIVRSAGLHLDLIPAAAGKGNAARFLIESWGVAPEAVMVFGDTGNDIDLFQNGFRGTVVANALPELIDAVRGHAYCSSFAYADGVLDGIRHWSGRAPRVTDPRTGRRQSDRALVATRRSSRMRL
jgi:sucrose-6F-phosphate phosphohydrolase